MRHSHPKTLPASASLSILVHLNLLSGTTREDKLMEEDAVSLL